MKKLPWLLISAIWLILDQWIKILAVAELKENLPFPHSIDVSSFLSWTYAENYGAAFSFLANQSGWQKWFFIIVGIIIIIVLLITILKPVAKKQSFLELFAFASVLGGAIGNVYDRASLGYVIDMIDVHYQPWNFQYAIFNVADIAISVGVGFLLIDWVVNAVKERKKNKAIKS